MTHEFTPVDLPPSFCVADYETYFDTEYSLRKMPASAYIYHPLFEIQCLSVLCPAIGLFEPTHIAADDIRLFHRELALVSKNLTLVGQNSIGFDSLIFAKYGIHFDKHIDTQVLSRFTWGNTVMKHSLEEIAKRLHLQVPDRYRNRVNELLGTAYTAADSAKLSQALSAVKGKRLADIPANLLEALMVYCDADVWLTAEACRRLGPKFPKLGYRTMTANAHALCTLPLELDVKLLGELRDDYTEERDDRLEAMWHSLPDGTKYTMLDEVATKKVPHPAPPDVMMKYIRSKDKLAWLLLQMGALQEDIPMKAGKNSPIYAFSKDDVAFTAFAESYDDGESLIPEMCNLRLDYSTTAYESKVRRYLQATEHTPNHRWGMHIHTYGAANTARHSGGNACGASPHNITRAKGLLHAPSCGANLRFDEDRGIRDAIMAPEGMVMVVFDSSGVELRAVGYITMEPSITDALNDPKRDLYIEFARVVFNNPALVKSDKGPRFVAKLGVLSLQYLTGWRKLLHTCAVAKYPIDEATAKAAHASYRTTKPQVVMFWEHADRMMRYWSGGARQKPQHYGCVEFPDGSYRLMGCKGIILTRDGFELPNGYRIRYTDLKQTYTHGRLAWSYWNGSKMSRTNLHPGQVLENIAQAVVTQIMDLAVDNIIAWCKAESIPAQYVGQVHDELVFICPPAHEARLSDIIVTCMKASPPWWPEIILNCEGGNGWGLMESEAINGDTGRQRYGFAK